MRLLSVALVVLALSPSLAKAVPVFNVNSVNCSGTLTSSFASVVSLGCAGNLSLDGGLLGGTLSADSQVILTADTISLANLYMTAPVVTMSAINWIDIGVGTTINATNVSLNAGTVTQNGSIIFPAPTARPNTLNTKPNTFSAPIAGSVLSTPRAGSVLSTPRAGSITLPAPTGGSITAAGLTNLSVPPFTTSPITILSPVPEPSMFATMLAGLLVLAGLAMINRKQFSSHFA